MKPYIFLAVICLVVLGENASSLDWQSTPVQDAVRLSLAASDKNPFDTFGGKAQDTAKMKKGSANPPTTGPRKSVMKAALWSVLVPGGGEFYLGHKRTARYFFTTEALTWVGFASFRMWGHWKKDDYIRFAHEKAGANLAGKSDEFDDLVGFYTDITQYNTLGRVSDPQRPYLYDTPDNHWRWQSTADQLSYRSIKNQSREAYRRANFMIGVAIVSRVISVVDAILATHKYNRGVETSFTQLDRKPVEFHLDPMSSTSQVSLLIHTDW